jgi:hypothetical protein
MLYKALNRKFEGKCLIAEFPLTGSDSNQVTMVEHLQQNEQAQVAGIGGLVFEDEQHNTHTLQALNMMRKNRHFCDVILHVSTTPWHATVAS